jgi:D-methionine transport system permease protein
MMLTNLLTSDFFVADSVSASQSLHLSASILADKAPVQWDLIGPLIVDATVQTLHMVVQTIIVGGILGLILGVVLWSVSKGGLFENKIVYQILNFIINLIRPIPFIIFMSAIQPLTLLVVGTSLGISAAIFPMTIFCTVATSRLVEQALVTVDKGTIEAARSMGAKNRNIIFDVVISQALAPLILSYAFLFVGVVDMSAMAGLIGGGGLGDFAKVYGYNKFTPSITWVCVGIIIVMVQLAQGLANLLAKRLLHRSSNDSSSQKVKPSSEQVQSITDYILKGGASTNEQAFSIEVEHFLDDSSSSTVPYSVTISGGETKQKSQKRVGIADALNFLAQFFADKKIEDGLLVGLERPKFTGFDFAISLSPGGQIKTYIGGIKHPKDALKPYGDFLEVFAPFLSQHSLSLVELGYRKSTKCKDMQLVPTEKNKALYKHLRTSGKFGRNVILCSAGTSVAINFSDEADAIKKARIATALGPIFSYMFANSPYFEGEISQKRLLRMYLLGDIDQDRSDEIPELFSPSFNLKTYAKHLLAIDPITAQADTAQVGKLSDKEIEDIFSTSFFDTVISRGVGIHSVDSLPIEKAIRFLEVLERCFYDTAVFKELTDILSDVSAQSVREAKFALEIYGDDATVYSKPYKEFAELLSGAHAG